MDPEALVAEKVEAGRIRKKAAALKTDLLVQIGYLPLTMHWCVSPFLPLLLSLSEEWG